VNLILFAPGETTAPLSRKDPRARHLLRVLARREGETFDAGLLDGPRGKGTVVAIGDDTLTLSFTWDPPPPPLPGVILLIGLPRPQTARDILRDATTLGATSLHFIRTSRSDPNYAASSLWSSGEWRRHTIAGAEQAFDTRLPEVTWTHTLAEALARLPSVADRRALDLYEATEPLRPGPTARDRLPLVLALGPERGWDQDDRAALRAAGFTLVHLGPRVLRTETAVVAALARCL
jgi:RsmE family RNA methyltransferase